MKARKNTKTEQNTKEAPKDALKDATEAVAAEDTATTPEAATSGDVTVTTEPKTETDNDNDVKNTTTVEAVPDDAPDSPETVNTPFSRLSKIGKYITLLEMYEGDFPRGSKMSEFLGCLRPLTFELQLAENVKSNKEPRDNVILPGGRKGYKALQASITHLEKRVRELYADIFADAFPDETKSDDALPPT